MRNRLHDAASPYLRQHAANPVHWQPWEAEAFALATREGKPILLSIGYSACHWCHAMARESFADPAAASVMNRLFVCIKVDREERPDLDRHYLGALARLGRQAGWPLTAFLTPGGDTYWGGGYYPPVPSFGLPAFTDVLQEAAQRFQAGVQPGGEAVRRPQPRHEGTTTVSPRLLNRLAHELARSVDWLYGGFGIDPPKFLHAGGHEILLRGWARTGEAGLLEAATGSLTAICNGGVYDHVGGGFHRYAVDDRWRVPHFEKMLCDNALMVGLLVKAWQATQAPVFASRVAQTISWLLREMRLPDAPFASSLAAGSGINSATGEGAFYTWPPGEVRLVLGDRYPAFAAAYEEARDGPFAPGAVLVRQSDTSEAAHTLAALLQHRDQRARPACDEKVLADWNGLAITALAEAGLAFARPDWVAAARDAFTGVLGRLATPDGLRHSAFEGQLGPPGFLEDYACLAQAALALHEAMPKQCLLVHAQEWINVLDRDFWDDQGGYFMTRAGHEPAIARQTLIDETVAPSGNGTMLGVLPRLASLTGEERYRRRAEAITRRFAGRLTRASVAGATALNNGSALERLVQIVIVGARDEPARDALLRVIATCFVPDRLLLVLDGSEELAPGHLAHGKAAIAGRAAAYVCVGITCLAPITDAAELRAALTKAGMSG